MNTGSATITSSVGVRHGLPVAARKAFKKRKYRNEPTTYDGIRFASKREAARYLGLKAAAATGKIRDLELQPSFPIVVNGKKVCVYRADFSYWIPDGHGYVRVVEDVKGVRTPVYKLKKALMFAVLGIDVREV